MLLYECLYFKKLEVLKVFLDLVINVFTVIFNQFNVYLLDESINSFYWKFFEGYTWCILALFSVGISSKCQYFILISVFPFK